MCPVVYYLVVGTPPHLLLRPLARYPFFGLLLADAVALGYALYPDVLRGGNDNNPVNQFVETRLEEYGTFHPLGATLLEVFCHGRVYDGVDGVGVGFRLK